MIFAVTRVILTIIGVFSRLYLTEIRGSGFLNGTNNIFLSIWGVWDSSHYLTIANNWYTPSPVGEKFFTYAFSPLYPGLMRAIGWMVDSNFLAGVIISNISLIAAAIMLYKIVRIDYDENTALRSVKFLFLFPAAFIFSGIFTESLYLALAISCFYFAKKENWLLAGTAGLLVSMTKSAGILIFLPILYEYLSKKGFRLKNVKKDILYLSLIPAGLFIVCFYNLLLTNDFFALHNARVAGWLQANDVTQSPTAFSNHFFIFNEAITVVLFAIFAIFNNKLQNSYKIFTLTSLVIAAITGALLAMLRYVLVIFPFFILFAILLKNKPNLDKAISLIFLILQAVLMAYWTNGSYFTL